MGVALEYINGVSNSIGDELVAHGVLDTLAPGSASTRIEANAFLSAGSNDTHDERQTRSHDDQDDDQMAAAKSAPHAARARALRCGRLARGRRAQRARLRTRGQRGDKEGCGTDRAQANAEATYADIIFGIQAISSTYEGAINLSPPPPKTATTTTARLLPPSLRARTSQHPFPRAYLPRRSVHLLCQPASQSPCPAGCQPASPPSSQPASMPGNKPASLVHLRPPS